MSQVTESGFLSDIEESGFLSGFQESDLMDFSDEELGRLRLRLPKIRLRPKKKFRPGKRIRNAVRNVTQRRATATPTQEPVIIPGPKKPIDYKKVALGVVGAGAVIFAIHKLT